MTRDDINKYLAAILTTLADVTGPVGESTIYIALGCDLGKWTQLRSIMLGAGLIRTSDAWGIELTAAGRVLAEKITAIVEKQAGDLTAQASI